jgi:hypothetical protein
LVAVGLRPHAEETGAAPDATPWWRRSNYLEKTGARGAAWPDLQVARWGSGKTAVQERDGRGSRRRQSVGWADARDHFYAIDVYLHCLLQNLKYDVIFFTYFLHLGYVLEPFFKTKMM